MNIIIKLKGNAQLVKELIESQEVQSYFGKSEIMPEYFIERFVLTPEQKKQFIGAIINEAHRLNGKYHTWYWTSDKISCGDSTVTNKGYEWEDSIECDAGLSFENIKVKYKGNEYYVYVEHILQYGSNTDTNNLNFIATRDLPKEIGKPKILSDYCARCGRGFSDKDKGNATRIDPKKYWQTTDNCENFCTACFYQYDAGFSGRELEQTC